MGKCARDVPVDSPFRFPTSSAPPGDGRPDRRAGRTVATTSLDGNQFGDRADELLGAYGIAADAIRIDYYRRLWEASEITPG